MAQTTSSSAATKEYPVPLKASERKVCHAARDTYFKCMEQVESEFPKPTTESSGKSKAELEAQEKLKQQRIDRVCGSQREDFDVKCPKAWVKYFITMRAVQQKYEPWSKAV
eukprot:CAMPEP_0184701414 /NCGR_PEP_ID=MMETSP0313-20130426/19815_1 /TAXON_ID=2792 /ORGANISM="Porphyridium aerugineum, Strain SAG 1380-2" /LENGTH=110 /DNA_ID=CAMNT_0027161471 /DNA_START=151 /DNA_END=479 /DNA_ORIENTATION=-